MTLVKTLGGDRINSGRKMKVALHAYERSTHNRSYKWRNTQSPGTVVPFMVQVGTPGATFDIDLHLDVVTKPTLGPLFGSFDLNAMVYVVPVRLYQAWLHNNKTKIGLAMQNVKLPQYTLIAHPLEPASSVDNAQINPSCILAYTGVRGIGLTTEVAERDFNAVPLIGIWDIYKNYYANKQEEIGAFVKGNNLSLVETVDEIQINTITLVESPTPVVPIVLAFGMPITIAYTGTPPIPEQILIRIVGVGGDQQYPLTTLSNNLVDDGAGTITGTVTNYTGNTALSWRYETNQAIPLQSPRVVTFPLENIDDLREQIIAHPGPDPYYLNDSGLEPFTSLLADTVNDRNPRMNTQEGLPVKCYKSDLLNNWLNAEWIDDINTASRVTTVGNFFSIDALNMAEKKYNYLNRVGATGGTYKDWMEASYTHINFLQTEIPIFVGGLMKSLAFQEVVSQAQATGEGTGNQPLGTLAGRGVMTDKHKGGKIRAKLEEICYVIGLFDITPNVIYSQGNTWDSHLTSIEDFHKPVFDQIGFQDTSEEQAAWWATTWDAGTDQWIIRSIGKQPAWMNYMTEIDKAFGNFAEENAEMFMTLNRRYEKDSDGGILDMTTYIDPAKYNYIFADTRIDAMNFWVNMQVNIEYRGKMSGKLMPML